ncbi:type IV secretion system DNA-binding domain-containing protein [Geomonas paludis]|uniref:Conjugative transfer protein TraD n=1 Tax=Geomonas paludis TaxID=2740185 RepID=A0A6V8MUB1_9BACT|nr:type IV secretion system DNA-binding domain-containing protein [Geomonas paludis]GFO63163.1 conjugative transfer protein TraD [Geomonas paludis]
MSFGTSNNSGYQGIGMWAADLKLKVRIWTRISAFAFVLYICTFGFLVYKIIPAYYFEVSWKLEVAKLFKGSPLQPTFTIRGGRYPASYLRAQPVAYRIEEIVVKQSKGCGLLAALVFPLTYGLAFYLLRAKKAKLEKGEHIRGMRLIPEKELAKKAAKQEGRLPFGSVYLPVRYEAEHVMIAGKTQVGKTVALMQQLEEIREAGLPAVIYDFKGEYVQKFYTPGIDYIANPLDERGLKWNIFDDIDTIPDISAVTGSLIPPGAGEEHFWCKAAQDVLRGVIAGLYQRGDRTNEDLWRALSSHTRDVAEICDSIEQGAAGLKYIEDVSGKQAAIVGAVLMSYVSWLEFACNGCGFTIKDWINNDRGSFIFITGRPEVENTLRPYLSLFIDLLGKRLLSSPDDPDRRVYFLLDEFGNLQRLPTITRLLTAGGSKGASMILGFQDFAAIAKTYGNNDAATIMNSCGTSLVLKLADEATAKIFSGRFGETQDWEITETRSIGQGKSRDSVSYSRVKRTDRLILPSEIQGLPKLAGYLLIPEHEPAKIELQIRAANRLPVRNRDFILRSGLSLDTIRVRERQLAQVRKLMEKGALEPAQGYVPGTTGGLDHDYDF